jgi:hypothetical protein
MYSVVKIVLTKTTKKNINDMNVVFLTNDKNILFLLLRGHSKHTCSNGGEGGVLQNDTECHSGGRVGIGV